MITFDDISDVFDGKTVWSNDRNEMYFYRWAWERIADPKSYDTAQAVIDAATLIYAYQELCYHVCDQNFYEDLWYLLGDFTEHVDLLSEFELGYLCGQVLTNDDERPDDDTEAMQILVRNNHEWIASSLFAGNQIEVLTAFYASYANPQRVKIDEDGDEIEFDLITSYEDFCRYVSDENFRNQEIGGATQSEFQTAYEWISSGAEMLEARSEGNDY